MEGVGGAYLRLMSPPPVDLDLEAIVDRWTEKMTAGLPSFVDIEGIREMPLVQYVAGRERAGVRKTFDFALLWLDFVVSLDFHVIETQEHAGFLVTLAVGGAEDAVEPAFELIRRSLTLSGHGSGPPTGVGFMTYPSSSTVPAEL